MSPSWYESIATRRNPEAVQGYAEWLGQIPWTLFATFTFAWSVSDAQADQNFMAFINDMERHVRSPITFVRGDEKRFSGCGMPESPRHYHVLLTSLAELEPKLRTATWRKVGGSGAGQDSAKVEAYDAEQRGAEYCLKFINETEGDWKFRHLDLFLPGYQPGKDNKGSRRRASRNLVRESFSD